MNDSAVSLATQKLRFAVAMKPVPPSLPHVALWAALPLQRFIAAEELTAVASQIRNPANGSPRGPALGWLEQYDTALTGKPPGNLAGGILDPASIYRRLVDAKVPPRKRIDTFLGGLEALLGKAPSDVREELGFLRKAESVIPPSLDALQSWAGEHLAEAAHAGSLRPVFDEMWVGRVAATLNSCPIADEKLDGEIGTPLFTRTVTQARAVATEAGTATSGKPPATLAPAISTCPTSINGCSHGSGIPRSRSWIAMRGSGLRSSCSFSCLRCGCSRVNSADVGNDERQQSR